MLIFDTIRKCCFTRMNVHIFSRNAVEKLLRPDPAASLLGAYGAMLRPSLPDNAAVVCFYDGESLDYSGVTERVFPVALIDADIVKAGDTYELSLPQTIADELARFVFDAVADGCAIVCQCEQGRNRSAGCAAAIREYFSGDGEAVFSDPRYEPDRSIFRSVYEALQREGERRKQRD